MNEGRPKHPVDMFQHFYHVFFKKAPPALQERTQHIHDFLLAATGYDESYDEEEPPFSQLEFCTCNLRVDSIIFEWGMNDFRKHRSWPASLKKKKKRMEK